MTDDTPHRILLLDPVSGIAGDMFVAALLELGCDLAELRTRLQGLSIGGFSVGAESVRRGSIAATHFTVLCDDGHGGQVAEAPGQPHDHHPSHGRTYREIVGLLEISDMGVSAKERALAIFAALAEGEARVHGCELSDVHFHEVGAVDSIVDIAAAAIGLEMLEIDEVWCRRISVGQGTVQTDHGCLPLPCPATAEILKGMPIRLSGIGAELVTPTGAAILKAVVTRFLPEEDVEILSTGFGAGTLDRPALPNVLRAMLCRPSIAEADEKVVVMETQVDDMTSEQLGYLRGCLERGGALDVIMISAQMKKNRPGHLIQVLSTVQDADAIERLLFAETTTFGVRRQMMQRRVLQRCTVPIRVCGQDIRIKLGRLDGENLRAEPEYDDVAALAHSESVSFFEARRRVMDRLSHEPVEWPDS